VPLNLDVVGRPTPPVRRTWSASDVMLYALAVGAGQNDPAAELEFTTENTESTALRTLPTFACVLMGQELPDLGDFDSAALLHAEQTVTVHRPIPVHGTAESTTMVRDIFDKGAAAIVVLESTLVDATDHEPLATVRSSLFVRGEGGFGGDRGAKQTVSLPGRTPDRQVRFPTRPEQALLYRLTGDRNPLHSDPNFAKRGGFARPILHGMCTYGYTARALVAAVCESDTNRFHTMSARFSAPLFPGDALDVDIWLAPSADVAAARDGTIRSAYFRASSNGTTVIDQGRFDYIP
jgi:acyl dehydratase